MKKTKITLSLELEKRAQKVFEQIKEDQIWINENGVFFTSKNLALNSVEGDLTAILPLTREQLSGKPQSPLKKLVIPTVDGVQLAFIDLKVGDNPTIGDKAKIGNKNAQGVYKIDPQTSFKFDKGELTEIITEQPNE